MENINQSISLFLKQAGVHPSDADWVLQLILIAGIVLISFLCIVNTTFIWLVSLSHTRTFEIRYLFIF